MQQIIRFLTRNSITILFLLLLGIAFFLTIKSHSYHQSVAMNSSNKISGFVYDKVNNVQSYFGLKQENEQLAKENAQLQQLLYNSRVIIDSTFTVNPDLHLDTDYHVMQSLIIKNSYAKKRNYLTIKGGKTNGIKTDMGVINSNGVVGIVENVSDNYAIVQSILNLKTKIAAKISDTEHFGTVVWDGKNAGYVQLIDIPKLANLHKGDTVVTGGNSTIFPENIPIGFVEQVFTSETSNFYTINVRLFNDMTRLQSIYIIENVNIEEITELEQNTVQDE
ncbi:MAG TPA: rod shape-determining protein MreC [Flavobacterium sp.]|nr:rod shape-determining protein MreC [Flavobacterium sp.]